MVRFKTWAVRALGLQHVTAKLIHLQRLFHLTSGSQLDVERKLVMKGIMFLSDNKAMVVPSAGTGAAHASTTWLEQKKAKKKRVPITISSIGVFATPLTSAAACLRLLAGAGS